MISKRLRYEILRRDDYACRYCGGKAPDVKLTVDHVQPSTLGGSDEPSNLVTACADCNAGKSSTGPDEPIVEDVAHDALRWRRAMDEAATIQADHQAKRDAYIEAFDDEWWRWRMDDDSREHGERDPVPRASDWRHSIAHWFDLGLELKVLTDAVEITMRRSLAAEGRWRYFCGVVWRTVSERQEIAQGLLAKDEADGGV